MHTCTRTNEEFGVFLRDNAAGSANPYRAGGYVRANGFFFFLFSVIRWKSFTL